MRRDDGGGAHDRGAAPWGGGRGGARSLAYTHSVHRTGSLAARTADAHGIRGVLDACTLSGEYYDDGEDGMRVGPRKAHSAIVRSATELLLGAHQLSGVRRRRRDNALSLPARPPQPRARLPLPIARKHGGAARGGRARAHAEGEAA